MIKKEQKTLRIKSLSSQPINHALWFSFSFYWFCFPVKDFPSQIRRLALGLVCFVKFALEEELTRWKVFLFFFIFRRCCWWCAVCFFFAVQVCDLSQLMSNHSACPAALFQTINWNSKPFLQSALSDSCYLRLVPMETAVQRVQTHCYADRSGHPTKCNQTAALARSDWQHSSCQVLLSDWEGGAGGHWRGGGESLPKI